MLPAVAAPPSIAIQVWPLHRTGVLAGPGVIRQVKPARLRVPHHENALDKQIAAIALVYDLTLVTRNTKDVIATGVWVLNPFAAP